MPNKESDRALTAALGSTPSDDIRDALKAICDKSSAFQHQLLRGLADHKRDQERGNPSTWKPCDRCGLSGCTSKSTGGRCRYHPGEIVSLNPWTSSSDPEPWEEYDYEEAHHPDAWEWSCCGKAIGLSGCKRLPKKKPKPTGLPIRQIESKPQATRQRLANHPYGRPNLKLVAIPDHDHVLSLSPRNLPPCVKAAVKRLPAGAKGYYHPNHPNGRANLKLVAVPDANHDPSTPPPPRDRSRVAIPAAKRLPVGAKGYNHPHGRLNLKLVAGQWVNLQEPRERYPSAKAEVRQLPIRTKSDVPDDVIEISSGDEEMSAKVDLDAIEISSECSEMDIVILL